MNVTAWDSGSHNSNGAGYWWNDLDLGHGFHETAQRRRFAMSESGRREILSRLLRLNHEKWEEEQKQGAVEERRKRGSHRHQKERVGNPSLVMGRWNCCRMAS